MRKATLLLAIIAVCFTGCGSSKEQAMLNTTMQNVKALEIQLQKTNERLNAVRSLIHQLESNLENADRDVEQVPRIRNELNGVKKQVASLNRMSEVLKGVSRKGNDLVVKGLQVTDESGNLRCQVSAQGLSIADAKGKTVCEIKYEEHQRAMSAMLRGRKKNSVALYAGEDRAMIGAYDVKGAGVVGWAATVTPDGQVTAGNAKR